MKKGLPLVLPLNIPLSNVVDGDRWSLLVESIITSVCVCVCVLSYTILLLCARDGRDWRHSRFFSTVYFLAGGETTGYPPPPPLVVLSGRYTSHHLRRLVNVIRPRPRPTSARTVDNPLRSRTISFFYPPPPLITLSLPGDEFPSSTTLYRARARPTRPLTVRLYALLYTNACIYLYRSFTCVCVTSHHV